MVLSVDDTLQLHYGFLLAGINAVDFGRRLADWAGVLARVPTIFSRDRQRVGDCALRKRVSILSHSALIALTAQIKKRERDNPPGHQPAGRHASFGPFTLGDDERAFKGIVAGGCRKASCVFT